MLKKKSFPILFLLMALCLSLRILPSHAHALGEGCNIGGCTCYSCGWRYVYSYTSEDYHLTNVACTGCSAIYGVSNDPHTFSGNTCTLCGYTKSSSGGGGGGGTSCDHGRYYYDYSYYNYSYHYVSQTCRYCGEETDYYRENHSLSNSYNYYSSSQHTYESYCVDCNEAIDSYRDSHRWSYNYRTYSSTQHRVDMTCRDCDYSTTNYESHWDSNSDGYCDNCSERLSVTVTWNAGTNGGTVNGSSSITTSVNSGSVASAPSYTPVKSGYTFRGWYTSSSGGSLYNTVSVTSARTFYAQFTANSYTVTWNANGGTPSSSTSSQTYGSTLTMPYFGRGSWF